MKQPLEGVRVADFSHVMAGPFATHLLRLLGADVIKIEAPTRGDAMRYYGADRRYDGMAPAFVAVNAGKRSICLDLKDAADLEIARAIVARCDVLVENFRPGVMARLGLGFDAAKALRPDIVYCSVSGYGQSGPLRDWPAIDNIVQATSGMMSLGGDPGDPPMRVGFPAVDTLTGQTAAFAILAALLRRARGPAQAQLIDVAMFDASLSFMTSAVVPFLVTGKALQRTGQVGYSGQPTSGVFRAADGRYVSLGVVQQHQFERLAALLGMPQWLEDPRFRSPQDRLQHSAAMLADLDVVLSRQPAEHWEKLLSDAGIPCGMVRDVGEAISLPHVEGRGLKQPITVPGLPDPVAVLNAGFLLEEGGPAISTPPPRLDEHRAEILRWLAEPDEAVTKV
jgi:crotonobetainyl-CoA:carnitine CoA-transferase CaiB-like acyl-CoA transferase